MHELKYEKDRDCVQRCSQNPRMLCSGLETEGANPKDRYKMKNQYGDDGSYVGGV